MSFRSIATVTRRYSRRLLLANACATMLLCVAANEAKEEEKPAAAPPKRFDLDAYGGYKKRFDLDGFYSKRFDLGANDYGSYGFLRKRSNVPQQQQQQKRFDLGGYGDHDYGSAQKRFDVFNKRFDIGGFYFQPDGGTFSAFAPTGPRDSFRLIDALPLERPAGAAFLDKRAAPSSFL